MAVEVGRYFLGIIDRTDHRAVTVSASTIGSEASQVLSNLVDVLQIGKNGIIDPHTNLLNLVSLSLDMYLILLGKILHILNLNPTGFAAVLHKLLEVSVQFIVSIKSAVAILGIQTEAASISKVFQLGVSDTFNDTHLGIVLFKSLGIDKTFLRQEVSRCKLEVLDHVSHHELRVV